MLRTIHHPKQLHSAQLCLESVCLLSPQEKAILMQFVAWHITPVLSTCIFTSQNPVHTRKTLQLILFLAPVGGSFYLQRNPTLQTRESVWGLTSVRKFCQKTAHVAPLHILLMSVVTNAHVHTHTHARSCAWLDVDVLVVVDASCDKAWPAVLLIEVGVYIHVCVGESMCPFSDLHHSALRNADGIVGCSNVPPVSSGDFTLEQVARRHASNFLV